MVKINKPIDLINNIFDKTGFIDDPVVYKKFIWVILDMLSRNQVMLPVIQILNTSTYTEEQIYRTLYYLPSPAPCFRSIFYPNKKED